MPLLSRLQVNSIVAVDHARPGSNAQHANAQRLAAFFIKKGSIRSACELQTRACCYQLCLHMAAALLEASGLPRCAATWRCNVRAAHVRAAGPSISRGRSFCARTDAWQGLGQWRNLLDERRGLGPKGITAEVRPLQAPALECIDLCRFDVHRMRDTMPKSQRPSASARARFAPA